MQRIICEKCNSTNVAYKEELRNPKHRKIVDVLMGIKYEACVSASKVCSCKCNECGHTFEIQQGIYQRKLAIGERYVD